VLFHSRIFTAPTPLSVSILGLLRQPAPTSSSYHPHSDIRLANRAANGVCELHMLR
jgi:hypothetical protein